MRPGSDPAGGPPPALEVEGIRKRFGGVEVLAGIDLRLDPGAVKCIIGPNGCGKSTFFNVLTGVLAPDAGRLRIDGVPADGWPPHRIARQGLLRKFQVPGVLGPLTVVENLELACTGAAGGGILATLADRSPVARLDGLLERAGLAAHRLTPVAELPHGLKQQLELLMLVSRRPRVLLLDEPTAGMTARETALTARLIRSLSADQGMAVLVIEHDMHFVRDLDCPVAVMLRGVIQREDRYDAIRNDPQVRAAYLGQAAVRSADAGTGTSTSTGSDTGMGTGSDTSTGTGTGGAA